MSQIRILFETPEDGVHSINRDDYTVKDNGYVLAFNEPESGGVVDKTYVPTHRVVRIDEKDSGN